MAADQILASTTSSGEMLFDWVGNNVAMDSIVETTTENVLPLQVRVFSLSL